MIDIKFRYTDKKGFTGMKIIGHAGYNPGNDPVCAGVSALGYALAGTLNNIKGIKYLDYDISDHINIRIVPILDRGLQDKVNIVFETVLIGLKQIALGYPEHITINKV